MNTTAVRWIALAGTLALAVQQPAQQPPVFRGRTNLVRVDVSVTDAHGNPVTTLTADDFEVQEDGVPQNVETFKLVEATGTVAPGDDTSLEIRSPEHAAVEVARDDMRVFLVFWDEYHIGQLASAINGRAALTDFVRNALGPTDLVALMDPLTTIDALRFTRDRAALADEIHKLRGRRGVYIPTRSVIEEAHLDPRYSRSVEFARAQVTATALQAAVIHLGAIREGRKAVLFVSEGVPLGRETYTWLDEMIRNANDNNTAVYTLDPRGLVGMRSDVLYSLADNTGGKAFLNYNAPQAALRQIVRDASAFYLIGYSPSESPVDGKFHKIKVRVKRPGVQVRARNGYVAPTLAELQKAREVAKAGAPPEIVDALGALFDRRSNHSLDLWIGSTRGADGRPLVTVAWTPRDGSAAAVSVIARSAAGSQTLKAAVADGRVAFTAPPGALQIDVSAADRGGDTIDREVRTVTVPDFSAGALTLGAPVVVRARTAREWHDVSSGEATPYAGRDFSRTDRLLVRVSLFGGDVSAARVEARLLSRLGTPLLSLPVTRPSDDRCELDLPLSGIARGEYVLSVEATRGPEQAHALVPLRVGP